MENLSKWGISNMNSKKMITTSETARRLNLSKDSIHNKVKRGILKATRCGCGRCFLFDEDDINKIVDLNVLVDKKP